LPLDDLNDAPQGGVPKWIFGAIGPLTGGCFGIAVIARGHITIPTRQAVAAEFHGGDATAWGLLIVAAACAAHCHYFWGNTDLLAPYADLGKVASLGVLAISAAFLFWRVFVG
jgi:hypothetical protein